MNEFKPVGLLAILALFTGCTTTTGQMEASRDVQAKGCLCAANQCTSVVAASGQAAVESAASGSFRQSTVGRDSEPAPRPPTAQPKRR